MCLVQVRAPILSFARVSNYAHMSNLFVEINHLGTFVGQASSGCCDPGHWDCQTQAQNLQPLCRDMSNKWSITYFLGSRPQCTRSERRCSYGALVNIKKHHRCMQCFKMLVAALQHRVIANAITTCWFWKCSMHRVNAYSCSQYALVWANQS